MLTILRPSEAAKVLGLSVSTLEKMRLNNEPGGPPFIRLSEKAIGYSEADLEAWIAKRRHSPSDLGAHCAA